MAADTLTSAYEDRQYGETPFLEASSESEDEPRIRETEADRFTSLFEMETPFLAGETEAEASGEAPAPEVAALAEMLAELHDPQFRESLENLSDEALEGNADRLAAEFGDRETLNGTAERLLTEHFYPLTQQTEAMLDRFFERLEGYEAEALTDTEIERVSAEVYPVGTPVSPASEQFFRSFLRKAGKLVSGAVSFAKRGVEGAIRLAGKGLSAIGKLALKPLLEGLKRLGRFLLRHVVRFALNRVHVSARPLARKLSDKLFRALGETEAEAQGENEGFPAAPSADATRHGVRSPGGAAAACAERGRNGTARGRIWRNGSGN
jgi:hypothetical protein